MYASYVLSPPNIAYDENKNGNGNQDKREGCISLYLRYVPYLSHGPHQSHHVRYVVCGEQLGSYRVIVLEGSVEESSRIVLFQINKKKKIKRI